MWEGLLNDYIDFITLEKGLSQNSIISYRNDISKFIECIRRLPKRLSPQEVTLEHISVVITTIAEHDLSPRTQARFISALKSFFSFLTLENHISSNPTLLLEGPKSTLYLPTVLTLEEIEEMIAQVDLSKAEGVRNKAIIETLYGCGLRVSELIQLKLSNIHYDESFIHVYGKGRKERLVPIGEPALDAIKDYLEDYRSHLPQTKEGSYTLFLNRRGKPISRVMIFTIIKELSMKANITRKVSPHTLRHSFATHLVQGGADLRAVQEMMGHESITTTEIYTHVNEKYLREIIHKYHPRA